MNLSKVEELLSAYLKENNLVLYSIEFVKEYGELILRICVDKEGGIDIDDLAKCNEFISAKLDDIDGDMSNYMLEVSSPGAEKVLKSLEEVKKHISSYIHVEIPNMVYEGTLLDVVDDELLLKYNAKGQFRKIKIPYEEIKLVRLAVKI